VPEEFLQAVQNGKDPVPPRQPEYPWPLIGERIFERETCFREMEPGESDEILCDFVVDSDAQVVEVYSYLQNEQKEGREIGWHLTTLYDLEGQRILAQNAPKPTPRKPQDEGSKLQREEGQ